MGKRLTWIYWKLAFISGIATVVNSDVAFSMWAKSFDIRHISRSYLFNVIELSLLINCDIFLSSFLNFMYKECGQNWPVGLFQRVLNESLFTLYTVGMTLGEIAEFSCHANIPILTSESIGLELLWHWTRLRYLWISHISIYIWSGSYFHSQIA